MLDGVKDWMLALFGASGFVALVREFILFLKRRHEVDRAEGNRAREIEITATKTEADVVAGYMRQIVDDNAALRQRLVDADHHCDEKIAAIVKRHESDMREVRRALIERLNVPATAFSAREQTA